MRSKSTRRQKRETYPSTVGNLGNMKRSGGMSSGASSSRGAVGLALAFLETPWPLPAYGREGPSPVRPASSRGRFAGTVFFGAGGASGSEMVAGEAAVSSYSARNDSKESRVPECL